MDATALAGFPTTLGARSTTQITALGQRDGETTNQAARKAANEFETVFLTNMLEGMFQGLSTDGPFGGGQGEKMFKSLLVGEYAKQITASGGLGIADHVYREILSAQERANQ